MLEVNLHRKKAPFENIPDGIDIQGWAGAFTKSNGCTSRVVAGKTVYDFSNAAVNWLRIPYAGTPHPLADDSDISVKFILKTVPSNGYAIVWSRFRQGDGTTSAQLVVYSDGRVAYAVGNRILGTSGNVKMNTIAELVTKRRGDMIFIYLNGTLILTDSTTTKTTNAYDWVIGSYFSPDGSIILATYAFPVEWTLLGLNIKKSSL